MGYRRHLRLHIVSLVKRSTERKEIYTNKKLVDKKNSSSNDDIEHSLLDSQILIMYFHSYGMLHSVVVFQRNVHPGFI